MNPDLIVRQVLVCASGGVYWTGVLMLAASIRRRTGRSANVTPKSVQERILWCGWLVVIVCWIGQPLLPSDLAALPWLATIESLNHPAGLVVGTLLILAGQLGTYWCYWAMGDSWRIGLDREGTVNLVTRGPYARMRHPIYCFQAIMLVGAACLLPTWMSLLIIGLQLLCSYVKALDEEAFLSNLLGVTYLQYVERTGRLWPRWVTNATVQPR